MRHLLNKEEAAKLLIATAEDWPLVSHILECPECQDFALAEMDSAMEPPEGEEPAACEARQPRGEARKLLRELIRLPQSALPEAMKDPRFHRADLVDLLLSCGETMLNRDPGRTVELARLAQRVAIAAEPGKAGSRARLIRGYCLEANGRRLTGEFDSAERALDDASLFLPGGSPERGPYCRALGLLRWEQGKVDEAAALLRHAARAYGEAGNRPEQGSCMVLLGLLYVEMGEVEKAPGPLVRGLMWAGAAAPPALKVNAMLSFCFCLAVMERKHDARRFLESAWLQYPHLEHPADKIAAEWLEGKVASHLGAWEEAERLLSSARRTLLTGHRPAEAALATLDLGALYLELDRAAEVDFLVKEFEVTTAGQVGADLAASALRDFAEGGLTRETAREGAALLAAWLRQTLRVRRLDPPPLPRF